MYSTTTLSEALTTGWDGMSVKTGQKQSVGAYTYFVRGAFNSGVEIKLVGTINLVD